MTNKKPDILDYENYRDFLKDRFNYMKISDPTLSFQSFATHSNTTRSYLKLVLEKARNTSLDKMTAIAEFFKLTPFEKQFLTYLFLKNICTDKDLKKYFTTVLDSLICLRIRRGDETDFLNSKDFEREKRLDPKNFTGQNRLKCEKIENWICKAILCLIMFPDYCHDPE